MSRKDFVLIANALAASRPRHTVIVPGYGNRLEQWYRTVALVSEYLERENPQFDADRFSVACNGPVENT